MQSYDAVHFDPPAPVAQVTLRHPATATALRDVLLLIDSGADITLLPRTAVEQLGTPFLPGERYELMGFDGTKSFSPVVQVDLVLLKHVFRGRYLVIDEDRGILGRDVLNHLSVLLDGPRQQWAEHIP